MPRASIHDLAELAHRGRDQILKGGWEKVTHLYRHHNIPEDRVWLRAPGWCLAHA